MTLRESDSIEAARLVRVQTSAVPNAPGWRIPQFLLRMSLRIQLLIAMVGLVALTAVSVGYTIYSALEAAIVPRGLARIEAHVSRLGGMIEQRTSGSREDIGAIAESAAVRGLVAATVAPDGRYFGLGSDAWRTLATETMVAQVTARPDIMQLRLVRRDGQEVVRIERESESGLVLPAPLQDKSAREYVRATNALPDGAVYVSPLDLNREQGEVEIPRRPVLRVATPIDDPQGRRWGLAILNLDLRPLLEELRQSPILDGTLYVVNAEGDYLLHPDPSKEFAFEFGAPQRIQDDFARLVGAFGGLDGIGPAARSLAVDQKLAAAASARLADRTRLLVLETVPDRTAVAGRRVRRSALLGGGIAAALAVVLAVLLAQATARPVKAMTEAVRDGGDSSRLPVRSAGEVGVLARSLARHIDNEHWHAAVLANSYEALLATTPDGAIRSWNPSARRLFGLTSEEAMGRPAHTIIPEEQSDALRDLIERVATGMRDTAAFEATLAGPGGSTTDVRMRISPVRSATGGLMGASILARDVTDERAARESFRIVTEYSPAGQLLIDPRGKIMLLNAEAERCFGYSREELLGQHFEQLVPDLKRAEHAAQAARYLLNPDNRAMGSNREVFGRRKDGSLIPLQVWLTTVPSRQGLLVLAAVVDVSERRNIRIKLEKRTAELERSNADLLQFAYVASHDMQEPLRITASFAQLLADRYQGQLDARADKYIHYIVDGARRMQALIGDILVYSRLGAQDDPVDDVALADVLDEARAQLAASIEESGARIIVEGELPAVRGERTQLERLFVNLLGNAIKYRGEEPPEIRVSAHHESKAWHIYVRDNGVGFDNKYRHKIFEMFQRIAKGGTSRGSGMGLAIAKRIVEQHGGDIWARGEPGKGATFEFTFPEARS